ncbi:HAE1 family hydrophobic/amphiphilic exporter-1 [Scopulibacillus daqui]|uniref:HAE1 family hydrophobic/amphiphilic exporter-1 n=1 Tax=Scopulibacillus daqui TaxID=1469162 RepID=A0ABS2Q1Q3_9BACL|nr:efflux RND transporter permease subunit [Scopulibacillus daqui]MBM7646194.1 HAE1 family hydrophobic/amphiphilic exporter-1 [Scopulibacillus daqui]
MNAITRFSLKNPVAIVLIAVLLLIGGVYSFSSLKMDLLPDATFPQLSIQATYPGASPEDVDDKVITPLEDKFKGLSHLKTMQSSSYENTGIINLTFPFNTDMDKMEREVNKLIDSAHLPDNATTEVNQFSFGALPIYSISLFAKGNENINKLVNDDIVPDLERIPGVSSVSAGGDKERYLNVIVDKDKARQAGISLNAIENAIKDKFVSLPAGTVTKGHTEIPVKVDEKLKDINALKNLQIQPGGGPAPSNMQNPQAGSPGKSVSPSMGSQAVNPGSQTPAVKLGDIAEIKEVKDQTEYTRYNLKPAISIAVSKQQSANTVDVSNKVMDVLHKYNDQVNYAVGFGQAEGIKASVKSLVREGLLGALFASIAVLIFLKNIRATLIAIISIPLSLLVSSICLKGMDITLNVMTLGGMAVAVGRVVDDSIVVIENIYRRIKKSGKKKPSNHLISESTKEILRAITSSTITTIVVFLPLGFVGGITGKFFLPFALTIVFSLLASLFVAVTIVPIFAKLSFKHEGQKEERWDWLRPIRKAYLWLVQKALNHKIIVIIVSLLLLIGSFAAVPSLGFTFLPNDEQKIAVATINLPAATSLDKTNDVSLDIEKYLKHRKTIKDISSEVGSRDFQTGVKSDNVINYFLTLKKSVDVEDEVKALTKKLNHMAKEKAPGSEINVQDMSSQTGPSNNNVNIDLYSKDINALEKAASDVEHYMKKRSDLKSVKNNLTEKRTEWVVQVDPKKASEYGVSSAAILGAVNDQTQPVTIDDVSLKSSNSIKLSYNKDIHSEKQIKDTPIFTQKGIVPLSEIADVKQTKALTAIQKLDGKIYARVSADITSDNIAKATADVTKGVKNHVDLPNHVTFKTGGGSDDTAKAFKDIIIAIVIAIGLVYLTMLITFGKARTPFVVLSSLVFVPFGAILGLLITKEPLSISVMIGVLMLIGIVTTNAIVFIDRIGQNRNQKGMTVREAVLEAGQTRLRPILMTAFATITALIPLALSTSEGTLISKGLAVVVIGGLTSSTLLTLILLPVLYELFFRKTAKKEQQD